MASRRLTGPTATRRLLGGGHTVPVEQRSIVADEPDNGQPKRERAMVAQSLMLDAALDLIAEGGLQRATLARVGERAGYSRGLADYHFGSKNDLVEKLIRLVASRWIRSVREQGLDRMTGSDALLAVVTLYMQRLESDVRDAHVLQVLAAEAVGLDPEIRERLTQHDELFRRSLHASIVEAQQDGSFAAHHDPVRASIMIEGLLRGIASQYIVSGHSFRPTEMTSMLIDTLMAGLASPGGMATRLAASRAPAAESDT